MRCAETTSLDARGWHLFRLEDQHCRHYRLGYGLRVALIALFAGPGGSWPWTSASTPAACIACLTHHAAACSAACRPGSTPACLGHASGRDGYAGHLAKPPDTTPAIVGKPHVAIVGIHRHLCPRPISGTKGVSALLAYHPGVRLVYQAAALPEQRSAILGFLPRVRGRATTPPHGRHADAPGESPVVHCLHGVLSCEIQYSIWQTVSDDA